VYAASERQFTAPGKEVQVPWSGIYAMSDGRWSKEIDTRNGKGSFIAGWSQNMSFQTPQSGLCCDPYPWS